MELGGQLRLAAGHAAARWLAALAPLARKQLLLVQLLPLRPRRRALNGSIACVGAARQDLSKQHHKV